MKVLEKNIIYLDIMMGGKFVRQIPYEYCPLFEIDQDEVKDYVEKKCPSLCGKRFNINFSNQRI